MFKGVLVVWLFLKAVCRSNSFSRDKCSIAICLNSVVLLILVLGKRGATSRHLTVFTSLRSVYYIFAGVSRKITACFGLSHLRGFPVSRAGTSYWKWCARMWCLKDTVWCLPQNRYGVSCERRQQVIALIGQTSITSVIYGLSFYLFMFQGGLNRIVGC